MSFWRHWFGFESLLESGHAHHTARLQESWQPLSLIDQLGEEIILYKLHPSLFTAWLILHTLLIHRRDYWLIIWEATKPCSGNLWKASSLSKITCGYWSMGCNSVRQILKWRWVMMEWRWMEESAAALSDLMNLYSPHFSPLHILMTFALFLFLICHIYFCLKSCLCFNVATQHYWIKKRSFALFSPKAERNFSVRKSHPHLSQKRRDGWL